MSNWFRVHDINEQISVRPYEYSELCNKQQNVNRTLHGAYV